MKTKEVLVVALLFAALCLAKDIPSEITDEEEVGERKECADHHHSCIKNKPCCPNKWPFPDLVCNCWDHKIMRTGEIHKVCRCEYW